MAVGDNFSAYLHGMFWGCLIGAQAVGIVWHIVAIRRRKDQSHAR